MRDAIKTVCLLTSSAPGLTQDIMCDSEQKEKLVPSELRKDSEAQLGKEAGSPHALLFQQQVKHPCILMETEKSSHFKCCYSFGASCLFLWPVTFEAIEKLLLPLL